MSKTLSGRCLCGLVTFDVEDDFSTFYQCHCKQCQQLTGSAFASNLFTRPDKIQWHEGKGNITHFHHPNRTFSKSFCQNCGSALPFVTKSGDWIIVPAGSLNEKPSIKLQAHIFCKEKAWWSTEDNVVEEYDGFVEK